MGQHRGTRPSDVLRHADPGPIHLSLAALAALLLDDFHDLINACRANRMTTRLQPATRTDGHAALWADLVIEAESYALASFRKSAGLEGKRSHDREGIVQ